jgi:hypothetical protein
MRSAQGSRCRARVRFTHRTLAFALALCAVSLGRSDPAPERMAVATATTWQGLITCSAQDSAGGGARSYLCSFPAPPHCRILSATATAIEGADKSLGVTIAADGTRVTSVVTAQSPRKPEISITAKLKCLR